MNLNGECRVSEKEAEKSKAKKPENAEKWPTISGVSKKQRDGSVPRAAGTSSSGAGKNVPPVKPAKKKTKTFGKRRREELRGRRNLLIKVCIASAAVLYFSMVLFCSFHFLVRSDINGMSVGGMTLSQAESRLQEIKKNYTLTVTGTDGAAETIHDEALNLQYKDIGDVSGILRKQPKWLWPVSFFWQKSYSIPVDISYDDSVLQTDISALKCMDTASMTPPADAYAALDENGDYKVYPEVTGTTIDTAAAVKAIEAAVQSGTASVDLKTCQVLPGIYSTDTGLASRVSQWNSYLSAAGSVFNFYDSIETLDKSTIDSLLTDDGTNVTVDSSKVASLMASWKEKHDTYGLSFAFKTHSGESVTIEPGGDYGYELNEEATGQLVTDVLNGHTAAVKDPSFYHQGLSDKNHGLGYTYVEISISAQTLWVYKDGNVVLETPVVTGLPTDGRETYKGCYRIEAKAQNVTLGTLDVQGYASPVSYWIPFNGGEGLHDAPWRTDFGGSIYLTDGSHGCVNIPVANMGTVYANVEENEAVVIY